LPVSRLVHGTMSFAVNYRGAHCYFNREQNGSTIVVQFMLLISIISGATNSRSRDRSQGTINTCESIHWNI